MANREAEVYQSYNKDGKGEYSKLVIAEANYGRWLINLEMKGCKLKDGPYFSRESTIKIRDFLNELLGDAPVTTETDEADEYEQLISKYK